MQIRLATADDIPQLADLFEQSVRAIAPTHYTAEQVEAWASTPQNRDRFETFILGAITFVAEDPTTQTLLGFGSVHSTGYLSALYVSPVCTRQGIGSRLLTTLINIAQTQNADSLFTEASEFSRPLFSRFGFVVYDTEDVARNGVQFRRYLMQRTLRND
jgi:putative acetyltransferase